MSGHNGTIAGLAVVAIVMVFASGWVSTLKSHIQGVSSVNAPTRVSTDTNPPAGTVIGGTPNNYNFPDPAAADNYPGAPIQIITGNMKAGQ